MLVMRRIRSVGSGDGNSSSAINPLKNRHRLRAQSATRLSLSRFQGDALANKEPAGTSLENERPASACLERLLPLSAFPGKGSALCDFRNTFRNFVDRPEPADALVTTGEQALLRTEELDTS